MTITKLMLEYSTGRGVFKIKPSAEILLPQDWTQKLYEFLYQGSNEIILRGRGFRYSRNHAEGETLRVTFGKFHLIFRNN